MRDVEPVYVGTGFVLGWKMLGLERQKQRPRQAPTPCLCPHHTRKLRKFGQPRRSIIVDEDESYDPRHPNDRLLLE
jgi:hypothetical protein